MTDTCIVCNDVKNDTYSWDNYKVDKYKTPDYSKYCDFHHTERMKWTCYSCHDMNSGSWQLCDHKNCKKRYCTECSFKEHSFKQCSECTMNRCYMCCDSMKIYHSEFFCNNKCLNKRKKWKLKHGF